MKRATILAGGALAAAIAAGGVAVISRSAADDRRSETSSLPDAPGVEAADAARGASVFRACTACHTVGRQGADVDGPNLYGVVGAGVAERRPRYGYTQALRDIGGIWTPRRLDAWLTDPAAVAPGTAMRFAGLPDPRDRADVIAYLATQGPSRR